MRKRSQLMAVFCILTLVLPGCSKKQVLVSAPQGGKSPYHKSSPENLSDQIRSVFKVSEINRWAKKQADTNALLQRYPEIEKTLAQVERDPSDLGAKRRLANFYAEKKLFRRALQLYTELGAIMPDDQEIQLVLGQIWDLQGAHSIALRHAVNAVELDPESVEALSLLGMVYLHREEPEKASRALRSALSLSPDDGDLLANTGFAFLQMKNWKEAANYLESALQYNPDSDKIRNNLGIAKVYLGDEEGAIEEFLKVSEPAVAYNNLGAAYLANKQWAEARDALKISLAWNPGYVKAELNLLEAESYLPPPSIVDLDQFNTRLAWLQSSWEQHNGINSQNAFKLPKQRLFHSSENYPIPLRRLGLPMQSISTSLSGQLPFLSLGEKGLPFSHGILEEKVSPSDRPTEYFPPEDKTNGLAELEPLPFTVQETDPSTNLQQAESPLTALLPGIDQFELDAQLASPVDMSNMGNLLSLVASSQTPCLGRMSPAESDQPLSRVQLAGGDLLNMLVKRPSFDWNAVAQPPEASYQAASAKNSDDRSSMARSRAASFPAQVWLVPTSSSQVTAGIEASADVAQTVRNEVAMKTVAFPFQLFSEPFAIGALPNLDSDAPEAPERSLKKVAVVENTLAEPEAVLEHRKLTASAEAGKPPSEVLATAPDYNPLTFDQFAAVREQVLATQIDPSEDPEMQTGIPSRASGLAGLAGAALILFSLGTTQLYLRFRSPTRRLGIPEDDPE